VQPVVSIVIPNWNGRAFLARCLAGTLQSAQESGLEYECIVVDDASTDGSAGIVAHDFPSVGLVRRQVNGGFGPTMIQGASVCTGEFLVCLNNDLVPKPALIRELVSPLQNDPQLFGVSGKTIEWGDGSPNHVNMAAQLTSRGIELVHSNSTSAAPTMFLQGGCCAFRREVFLQFGGFCELFAPGYWEDYDISYLALKAGWRNVYNPAAVAYHLGGASMGRAMDANKLAMMKTRNRHLFALTNLTDPLLLARYLNTLPAQVAFAREPRLKVRVSALLACVQELPEVKRVRTARAKWVKRTDAEIYDEFADHGR
jgi:GT2 family glycosyltransferase